MYISQVTSFVLTLQGSSLENIIESAFQLSYYVGIQPSEVDRLTTYEFRSYLSLLDKYESQEKDYQLTIAKNYGAGNLFGGGID